MPKLAEDLLAAQLSTKDVFERYLAGEPGYQSIIDEVTDSWAQGLYSISSLLDPHKIVFGGSVIANNPFLLEIMKEKLRTYQIPEQQHVLEQMTISTIKQNNGVVGAGLSVFDKI